jgi:hypothetical protein
VDGKTSRGARRADGTRVHLLGVAEHGGHLLDHLEVDVKHNETSHFTGVPARGRIPSASQPGLFSTCCIPSGVASPAAAHTARASWSRVNRARPPKHFDGRNGYYEASGCYAE